MVLPFLAQLAIVVVLNVAAYLITPRPKGPKPDAVQDADAPTASAGKPIPVLFGSAMIKEVNVLGYWDKATNTYEVKV